MILSRAGPKCPPEGLRLLVRVFTMLRKASPLTSCAKLWPRELLSAAKRPLVLVASVATSLATSGSQERVGSWFKGNYSAAPTLHERGDLANLYFAQGHFFQLISFISTLYVPLAPGPVPNCSDL